MRADALIGAALTDDSKSTKKKDAKTKNATEGDTRPTKNRAGSSKDDTHPYYYKVLDISTDASRDELKKAYLRLSMLYHPERPPTRMPSRR